MNLVLIAGLSVAGAAVSLSGIFRSWRQQRRDNRASVTISDSEGRRISITSSSFDPEQIEQIFIDVIKSNSSTDLAGNVELKNPTPPDELGESPSETT